MSRRDLGRGVGGKSRADSDRGVSGAAIPLGGRPVFLYKRKGLTFDLGEVDD